MSKLGRAVLAWDEFLHRDDYPEVLAELQGWLRSAGHGSLLDQGEAAITDVNAMMSVARLQMGNEARDVPYQDYPEWVRLSVLGTLARWITGQASTCAHSPSARRPEPVLSVAWKPDLVVCTACAHLTELPRRSAANYTCDGCGYVVPTTETIWTFTVSHGWLIWQAGVCGDCRFWTP